MQWSQRCCQGLPVSLEPLQRQQNTPLSNLLHPWVPKKKITRSKVRWVGEWDTTTILLLAKPCRMLKAVWAGHCHGARTSPHSATSLDVFIAGSHAVFPTHSSKTARTAWFFNIFVSSVHGRAATTQLVFSKHFTSFETAEPHPHFCCTHGFILKSFL